MLFILKLFVVWHYLKKILILKGKFHYLVKTNIYKSPTNFIKFFK